MKKALALLLCSSLLYQLQAITIYVATNGNDAAQGTFNQPLRTIPAAIEIAVSGDVIELRGGQYTSEEIRINKSNLTIRSYAGEWAVIAAPVNDENIASCIWYNDPEVTGGTLERLEITGGYYYGVSFETNWDWGLPERRGASNIVLRQCKIHDTGRDCVKIKPACQNIQIISCELYNSGIGPANSAANGGPNAEGVDNVNGDGMLVRNCYIHNISTSGVYVKGGASNCIVEENLIYGTFEAGILLGFYTDADFFDQDGSNPAYYECQYSIARNNIVYGTGGAGIGFFAARNCSAYNNTVITGSGDFHAPLYFSPGDIWIDENTTLHPANFNIEVYNNIFLDQSGTSEDEYTVQVREGAFSGSSFIDYNIYHKTSGAAQFDDGVSWPALNFEVWRSQFGFDTHSQEANPLVNNNLHLMPNSPAIDAGQSSPALRDYDALSRIGLVDIGADEYDNGAPLPTPPPGGVIGTGADANLTPSREEKPGAAIRVFPNPVSQILFLQIDPALSDYRATLTSLDGRISLIGSNVSSFYLSELPNGLYVLSISADEISFSKIIIVHH
ncbi:MAG TPA: right-handed parallel beta-helix repeat-containing protein [Saprospiraceae bacterium]|nr:right-handed parallel beta-helix repeat-containing protein [Saprospiraceae bacterium]HMQ84911.1 right-handed parallel beta-helix repeat-containing protein [Saprospiraceae bacterium]